MVHSNAYLPLTSLMSISFWLSRAVHLLKYSFPSSCVIINPTSKIGFSFQFFESLLGWCLLHLHSLSQRASEIRALNCHKSYVLAISSIPMTLNPTCTLMTPFSLNNFFSPLYVQTYSHNHLINTWTCYHSKFSLYFSFQIPVQWYLLAQERQLRTIISSFFPPYLHIQFLITACQYYLEINLPSSLVSAATHSSLNLHHPSPGVTTDNTHWAFSFHCISSYLCTSHFESYFYYTQTVCTLG